MRDEAERRIGHLYPKARLPDGSEATVIAWLWARTVRSPDPAAKGAMVPLVSSFMLSTKEGKKAWVEVVIDPAAQDGWRFEVRAGDLAKADEERLKKGTKTGRGTNFECVLSSVAIAPTYVKAEGMADRMGARLMAIVAEGARQRVYLTPTAHHEASARQADVQKLELDVIKQPLPNDPRAIWVTLYGFDTFDKLFTPRQLVALTTFSDLVGEAREKVLTDAKAAGRFKDPTSLSDDGYGHLAYADAVATYLSLIVGRCANYWSGLTPWGGDFIVQTFGRQALPMVWDHAEANIFSSSTGNFNGAVEWTSKALQSSAPGQGLGAISQIVAQNNNYPFRPALISTDPPYYDNIGYADLSDFFYVWLRRSLSPIWPELFRRLATPKAEELVATPYRHGSKEAAEAFFIKGMGEALTAMRKASTSSIPLAICYAF